MTRTPVKKSNRCWRPKSILSSWTRYVNVHLDRQYMHNQHLQIIGIPWPDRPPYEYRISPIAPCLRKEDPEMCFTRDMAVPIYPNTSHPHQREPIHTDPQFPFSNCYHWLDYHMRVHVRARAEMFDHSKAIMLPCTSYIALDRVFSEDRRRSREERNPRTSSSGASLCLLSSNC